MTDNIAKNLSKRKIDQWVYDHDGYPNDLLHMIKKHESMNGFEAIISWLNRNKSLIFDHANNYAYVDEDEYACGCGYDFERHQDFEPLLDDPVSFVNAVNYENNNICTYLLNMHDVKFVTDRGLYFSREGGRTFDGPADEDQLYFSFYSPIDAGLQGSVELCGYKVEDDSDRRWFGIPDTDTHTHLLILRITVQAKCKWFDEDSGQYEIRELMWTLERKPRNDAVSKTVSNGIFGLAQKYQIYPIWMMQRRTLCFLWAAQQPELSFLPPEIALIIGKYIWASRYS